jgi:hypothetical protein
VDERFAEKIQEARRAAERQDFFKAEEALQDVLHEAARSGDGEALAAVHAAAFALTTKSWGSWRRHFAALASKAEAAAALSAAELASLASEAESAAALPPAGPGQSASTVPAAGWVSTCVVLFAVAAAVSALGGLVVFFDQVRTDGVAAVTGVIVGAVAAALWIGSAIALVLLRDIAAGIRALTSCS